MSDARILRSHDGGLMVVTNAGRGDECYSNSFGHWNVSQALQAASLEGWEVFLTDVATAMEASSNVDVEPAHVEALRVPSARLYRPVLFAETAGGCFLLDGHHRRRALHANGERWVLCRLLKRERERDFAILFNGRRQPPWRGNESFVDSLIRISKDRAPPRFEAH